MYLSETVEDELLLILWQCECRRLAVVEKTFGA